MKIFVAHVNLGCCTNNSDGKLWVVAENESMAKAIIKAHTDREIVGFEEFEIENELLFSSFNVDGNYQLKSKTDNWGYIERFRKTGKSW